VQSAQQKRRHKDTTRRRTTRNYQIASATDQHLTTDVIVSSSSSHLSLLFSMYYLHTLSLSLARYTMQTYIEDLLLLTYLFIYLQYCSMCNKYRYKIHINWQWNVQSHTAFCQPLGCCRCLTQCTANIWSIIKTSKMIHLLKLQRPKDVINAFNKVNLTYMGGSLYSIFYNSRRNILSANTSNRMLRINFKTVSTCDAVLT